MTGRISCHQAHHLITGLRRNLTTTRHRDSFISCEATVWTGCLGPVFPGKDLVKLTQDPSGGCLDPWVAPGTAFGRENRKCLVYFSRGLRQERSSAQDLGGEGGQWGLLAGLSPSRPAPCRDVYTTWHPVYEPRPLLLLWASRSGSFLLFRVR